MEILGQIDDRDWMKRANCLGINPDLFFPERGRVVKEAREICSECHVKSECLEYALTHGEKWGVWGGTSERDRRVIRRKRLQQGQRLPL